MYDNYITNSNMEGQMDNIILGLLLLTDRTIYGLRERIDKGLNLMYSSSTAVFRRRLKSF